MHEGHLRRLASMRPFLTFVCALLLAAVCGLPATPASASGRVALVIGSSDYVHLPKLASPENDSRQIAEALRRLGFSTTLLLNPDQRMLGDAIAQFEKTAASADLAFAYYGGHALQVGGTNYLLPVDARPTTEAELQGLPTVDRLFGAAGAKNALVVVIDAARSDLGRFGPANRSVSRGLARMHVPANAAILSAAQPGAVAADGNGTNSMLAMALLKDIESPLDIEQMFSRTRAGVAAATRGAQVPWIGSNLTRQVFLGKPNGNAEAPSPMPPAKVAAAPAAPRPAPRPAPPPAPSASPEQQGALPSFPWPPPAASVSYVLPKALIAKHGTVGDLTDAIIDALERTGYVERSFYGTPVGGVVLMTRIERIEDDGSPAGAGNRWADVPRQADAAGLASFLRGLFFAAPGRYRVILFVVQGQPFTQDPDKPLSGTQAQKLLRGGANALPADVAAQQLSGSQCTALIYEFANDGTAMKRVDSRLTARQHLEKAGIMAQLEQSR